MTCVVGLLDCGKMYFGADSAGFNAGTYAQGLVTDPKVGKVGEYIFGYTSSFRLGQLFLHAFNPPQAPDSYPGNLTKFMATDFIKAWKRVLAEDECSPGDLIVGVKGRIYRIQSDYSILESPCGYAAIGCGAPYALGSLASTLGMSPGARLTSALNAAVLHSAGVLPPFNYAQSHV
jgi:ATP-dependent protease HslVU (ClpYQ) peptidase subunit